MVSEGKEVNISCVEGATPAEDLFIEIFCETFGLDKVQYLINEYPCKDIYDNNRYIDYALKTDLEKFAIEIDGEQVHNPALVSLDKYLDDLLKRNSLTYQGWKLYIWTYRQLVEQRAKVKSEILQFIGEYAHFKTYDDYLPFQRGKVLKLRRHQRETLDNLMQMRKENYTMALIADAQGTGKTTTAVLDAKRMGYRTLFVAHRREILTQAVRTFRELWPGVKVELVSDFEAAIDADVVIASIQGLNANLDKFQPDDFGYIIIDEAHHAAADSYRRLISYFSPKFLLGLTATPERHDQQSIMDIFQHEAHRLDLKTAVEIGELVPIRCVRVKTNIDFTRVRFNGIKYNYQDLDLKIHLPERNKLIIDTYLSHVPDKKAVVFCANVQHAKEVAELFQKANVSAQSVDGRMKKDDREKTLEDYKHGIVKVLCACDILNEGWDSPETAVLFMARPTLSKVIYLQQLGRGTRKAPGKDALLVFDFIDESTRYNRSIDLHRLLKRKEYLPGGLVLAPPEQIDEEKASFLLGEKPDIILPHNIYATDYEFVDIFDWQEEIKDMVSAHQMALELYVDDKTVLNWINNGKITPGPDLEMKMGNITHRYFYKHRIDDIRQKLGIKKRTRDTLKSDFIKFIKQGDLSMSYKPVMLKNMLLLADDKGEVKLKELTQNFREFYEERLAKRLPVENKRSAINRVKDMTDFEVTRLILNMPFEKFERKFFVEHKRDLNKVAFNSTLWKSLTKEDHAEIIKICDEQIAEYYENRVEK